MCIGLFLIQDQQGLEREWDWDWVIRREYETSRAVPRVFALSFTVSMGRDIVLSSVGKNLSNSSQKPGNQFCFS